MAISLETFTTVVEGQRRFVQKGRPYATDDPVVLSRPKLFKPIASQSTAEPAEKPKRSYRRSK